MARNLRSKKSPSKKFMPAEDCSPSSSSDEVEVVDGEPQLTDHTDVQHDDDNEEEEEEEEEEESDSEQNNDNHLDSASVEISPPNNLMYENGEFDSADEAQKIADTPKRSNRQSPQSVARKKSTAKHQSKKPTAKKRKDPTQEQLARAERKRLKEVAAEEEAVAVVQTGVVTKRDLDRIEAAKDCVTFVANDRKKFPSVGVITSKN